MTDELSQEEVFSNDIDPEEGLAQLRRDQAAAEQSAEPEEGLDELPSPEPAEEPEEPAPVEEPQPEAVLVEGEEAAVPSEGSEELASEDTPSPDSKVHKFKADGQEYEFTEQEMIEQFASVFGKAANFTQKTQKLAPYRKMISALEEEGITHEQLNVAIDALKGDKGAIAKIAQDNKVDPFELADDQSEAYTPNTYGKNEKQLQLDEIDSQINKDAEYPITVDVLKNQWDQESRDAVSDNPKYILGLHNDIKTGLYDKISPVANKMKVLDGNAKSNLEYYWLAGQQLQQETQQKQQTAAELNAQTQAAAQKFDQASSEAEGKRSVAATPARTDSEGVLNYLDDDDEKFDAWRAKVMAKI